MKKQRIFSRSAAVLLALIVALACLPAASAAEYNTANAVSFIFSDTSITATGGSNTGYKINGTKLTLSGAGTYILSGTCSNGSVKVEKGTTDVTLVLKGLSLTSTDTAPIVCAKSSHVTILAEAGSVNTLTDTAQNNDETHPENTNAENAVIKCKDGSQVTLGGSGTLNLVAKGKNGIKSGVTTESEGEAWLLIRDLKLNIDAAVNDGINAEQLLTIESGSITVSAISDGVHCDLVMNIGAADTEGPTITVTKCSEGLEAANLNIFSGKITVHAQDDCLNAANSDLSRYAFTLNISGGTLLLDTTGGDGIDSNGTLTISGGTTVVWTASTSDNQALDADGAITVTGGTVLAAGGSAGMGMRLSAGQPYVSFGSAAMGGFGGGGRPNKGFGGQTSTGLLSSGSAFEIRDASGNTVYSGTAVYNASSIFFSSPSLTSGSNYTLSSGGNEVASAAAGTSATGSGDQQQPIPGGQQPTPGGQQPIPGGQQPLPDDKESPPETQPSVSMDSGNTEKEDSAASPTDASQTGNGDKALWIAFGVLAVCTAIAILLLGLNLKKQRKSD